MSDINVDDIVKECANTDKDCAYCRRIFACMTMREKNPEWDDFLCKAVMQKRAEKKMRKKEIGSAIYYYVLLEIMAINTVVNVVDASIGKSAIILLGICLLVLPICLVAFINAYNKIGRKNS